MGKLTVTSFVWCPLLILILGIGYLDESLERIPVAMNNSILLPRKRFGKDVLFGHPSHIIRTVRDKIDVFKSSKDIEPSATNRSQKTQIVIYNRVPKCGSTTVATILRMVVKKNKFRLVSGNFSQNSCFFKNNYAKLSIKVP